MPSNKPQLKTNVNTEIAEKFKKIAEEQKRSTSNLLSMVIEDYIKEYEKNNKKLEQKLQTSKIS